MVEVFFVFLAVGGQFRPFQTLRFAVTFQTVHMPPLTSPCNPNFGPPKVPHFFSMRTTQRTTQPRKFRRFPIFGRFRTERTSRGVKTWPFQYRTPRSRPVIPSPRSFSASPILLTQFSGNFPPSLFNSSLLGIIIYFPPAFPAGGKSLMKSLMKSLIVFPPASPAGGKSLRKSLIVV